MSSWLFHLLGVDTGVIWSDFTQCLLSTSYKQESDWFVVGLLATKSYICVCKLLKSAANPEQHCLVGIEAQGFLVICPQKTPVSIMGGAG